MRKQDSEKKICGAVTKSGGICTQPAGKGTGHYGSGRCRLHEGNEPQPQPSRQTNQYLELQTDAVLRKRASVLLRDPELLDCRGELAMLKARMEQLGFSKETEVADLTRLSTTIARLATTINDMEKQKQHYLHVSITGEIISAFADLARAYILEPTRQHQFEKEMARIIRGKISQRSAKAVASSALTPKVTTIDATAIALPPKDDNGHN